MLLRTSHSAGNARGQDDAASIAAAAVAPALGFDTQAFRVLVAGAREALTQIGAA